MKIETWTIYWNPLDYPDRYVVRLYIDGEPTPTFSLADTLEEARKNIPPGLYCFPRTPQDDLPIVETWF